MTEPSERHLAASYAHEMGLLMNMPEGFEPNATWEREIRRLTELRHEHPSVISGARVMAAREAFEDRMAKAIGYDRKRPPEKHERAGIDDRAKQHMDADWNGHGARPSLMFEIGRRAFGKQFEDWALKTARVLFKAGKPANPFTTQHQERN